MEETNAELDAALLEENESLGSEEDGEEESEEDGEESETGSEASADVGKSLSADAGQGSTDEMGESDGDEESEDDGSVASGYMSVHGEVPATELDIDRVDERGDRLALEKAFPGFCSRYLYYTLAAKSPALAPVCECYGPCADERACVGWCLRACQICDCGSSRCTIPGKVHGLPPGFQDWIDRSIGGNIELSTRQELRSQLGDEAADNEPAARWRAA